MATPLTIGFLVPGNFIPAWYYETIQQVISGRHTVFFIFFQKEDNHTKDPFFYSLFKKFEERWFGPAFDAALLVSIEPLLQTCRSISISYDYTQQSLLSQRLNSLKADVIFSPDHTIHNIKLFSTAAAYGFWCIQFGFGKYAGNEPVGFWEVMDDSPVTGSRLIAFKNDKVFALYEGTTRTIPYSVKNNFNSIAWKSSSYLPFRLLTLEKEREAFLHHTTESQVFAGKKRKPRNIEMPFLFLRNIVRYGIYKIRSKTSRSRYTVLYNFQPFNLDTRVFAPFKAIPFSGPGVFYADPFIVEKDELQYVFIEEMVYAKQKAHISLITIDKNKTISRPEMVLDRPYHLSYPFVFQYEGEYFMIPETAANYTVEIYKARNFPYDWEFVTNLMENTSLIDVTLHYQDNKWWMFAVAANHPFVSANDQLFLFYSNDLFSGNWIPHPRNPIATHSSNCRPAGRIFSMNNKLYRPAQNNASQQYGFGLKINEIEVLNEEAYSEKEVFSMDTKKLGLKACHQIDFSPSLTVIDGIKA